MSWDRIRAARDKFETLLLSKANVVGVGVGKKIVRGKETDDPAVIVFVERKLPESQLRKKDIVPKSIDEVKTDVVETGRLKALSALGPEKRRTDRWRPAPGGVSVAHHRVTAGTLGGVVRRGDERLILSNNHVLANENDARRGDAILQPSPADHGGPDDAIARLERFVKIEFDRGGLFAFFRRLAVRLGLRATVVGDATNTVDAAVARPIRNELVDDAILGLGRPSGIGDVAAGESVRKSGRTTGLTEGRVLATEVTVQVHYARSTATFADQVVAGPMSRGGDSGSLVVNARNEVVGLLFAGSDTATIWNRSRRVADALGIEF